MTSPRRHRRRGVTLMELALSMAVTGVLMTGLASAVILATRAIPDAQSPLGAATRAYHAVEQMAGELYGAESLLEASPAAVKFTVADRDADGNPETIRYEWSQAPGDPLTRSMNAAAPVTQVENVQAFSLVYSVEAVPLRITPRILLVVPDPANLSVQDAAKQTIMESWGFPVSLISASAPQVDFDAAVASADAAYISEEVFSLDVGTKLTGASIGVLTEESRLVSELGISAASMGFIDNTIRITDNTHEITAAFPTGPVTIYTSSQPMRLTAGTLAGGFQVLAETLLSTEPVLGIIEVGATLSDGTTAAGRRVKLPWGDDAFDVNSLNGSGLTLMQRAIVWAAAPHLVRRIRVTLQTGDDPTGRVETQIQTLNEPRAAGS